jgi:hypothetical protein
MYVIVLIFILMLIIIIYCYVCQILIFILMLTVIIYCYVCHIVLIFIYMLIIIIYLNRYIEDPRLQWKRKTILTTQSIFPHLVDRIEVKSRSEVCLLHTYKNDCWFSELFLILIYIDSTDSFRSLFRNDIRKNPSFKE